MSVLRNIKVRGESSSGVFSGGVDFTDGLNILIARNGYGKSLLTTSVAWCLGLEPMFGLRDNDPSRFPHAVRDAIDLDGDDKDEASVMGAHASIEIFRSPSEGIRLTRAIADQSSEDARYVKWESISEPHGKSTSSARLEARHQTLRDSTGGLQHALFRFFGFERYEILDRRGDRQYIYLENIFPHVLIDQQEGWVDLQSLQVLRYGQQEIGPASFEAVLGERQLNARRLRRQEGENAGRLLRASLDDVVRLFSDLLRKQSWAGEISTHGAIADVAKRLAALDLRQYLRDTNRYDVVAEKERLNRVIASRREIISGVGLDPQRQGADREVEQSLRALKQERATLAERASEYRLQLSRQRELLHTLEHREKTASDLARLREKRVGLIEQTDCPTCGRPLELASFGLEKQSLSEIQAFGEVVHSQRQFMQRNVDVTVDDLSRTLSKVSSLDDRIREANAALAMVTSAAGTIREQVAKAASDLGAAEREMERLKNLDDQVSQVETAIRGWVDRAQKSRGESELLQSKDQGLHVYLNRLGSYLASLGHRAINLDNRNGIVLDDDYLPLLNGRRLRGLGSASDLARLIVAHVLAAADGGLAGGGNHPGFVILDEPKQQNPDTDHKDKLVKFLIDNHQSFRCQAIITTYLEPTEIAALEKGGVTVRHLPGKHLLSLDS